MKLWNQPKLFPFLDGLGSSAHFEFEKKIGRVRFDGVEGDEQFVCDLLVGKASGHQFQYFMFAFTDAEFLKFLLIENKFRPDYNHFFAGKFQSGSDTQHRKKQGDEPDIKFYGKVAHKKPVLQLLHKKNQCSETETVYDDGSLHA